MKPHNLPMAAGLSAALIFASGGLVSADDKPLNEIVVTAQKREERLIDVPMSITAIKGEDLVQKNVANMQDLSFAVPGLTTREDGPGSYTIFMRGLSNQYGNDALVGVYMDEAPLTLTGYDQLDSRPLDLDRVEVLKGPQGTLYGQGSVAGAIRYITKDPVLDAFQGRIEATGATIDGGAGKQIFTGILNAPIVTDKFALRIAGTIENGGGWQSQPQAGIHNGNYQDLINVRTKALWKISDDFTAKAMVVVHRNNSKLGLGYENEDRTITVAVDPAQVLIPKKFDYELYNLELNYDLQNLSFLSSTSYIDHRHQYPFSYIAGPQTIYDGTLEGTDARHVKAHMLAQELRMASRNSSAFKWTTGAFFRTLDRDENDTYETLFAGSLYTGLVYIADDTYRSYSLFGDASYTFADRVEVGAGARYFHDRQTTFDGTTMQAGDFHSTDPRVYASYKINHDVNVYASIAKGFRSGGFNTSGLPSYKPESLLSYEIGIKGSVADGRVGFELAGYYSDYTDMLRRGLVYIPATTMLTSITSNIGTVHIKGMEGGITWRATQALTLNTTASWINSEIVSVNATDGTNIAGDPVDYVPKFAFTAGANYGFNWAMDLPGFIRLDYIYRDKVDYTDRTSFPAANVPQTSDTLSLLDARLGITYKMAQFELFGSNLTNQNKWIDPYSAWLNANRTRPRMVGIKAIVNFN